jgi:tripartite ATP-independent transporter DctP family solute receptor
MSRHWWVAAGMALAVAMPLWAAKAAERLVFAHIYEESSPQHQEALWAAREIERRLGGRYVLDIFPNGVLGASDAEIAQSFRRGSADATYLGLGHVARVYGPMAIGSGPYVFRDYSHWEAFRDSPLFGELKAGYEDVSGMRVLGLVYYGQRHVTAKRTLRSADDFKGMIVRVPNIPSMIQVFRGLGATPVAIPFNEVHQALADGVVEAQENPLPTIKAMRFHEVAKVITLTGHITDGQLLVCRSDRWDAIPANDRAQLAAIFDEQARRVSTSVHRQEQELVEWFRANGVTVNSIDTQPLARILKPLATNPEVFPWPKALYERVQAIR